ncbi:MAG: SPOR domain-containing protein [Acetobacteraceae bacterium]|nr:SPOR domain-containing protein [Acetobacteraceae bacterium]
MIIIAGSVLAAGAVIAALVWGFSRGSTRNAPLIEADARPIKVRPDNPGGLRVPNQDELIFDRNRGALATAPGALAPEAEKPRVDQLRQQLAERAAQEAARSAPPAATPAPAQPAAPPAAARTPPAAAAPVTPTPPATTSALTAPSLPAPVPANAERFAPVANGRAQVQLGALPSEAAARGEWERLQRRVPELLSDRRVTLAPLDREGQTTMFRIRTGGFADAATARAFCEEMKTRSIPCMVIGG